MRKLLTAEDMAQVLNKALKTVYDYLETGKFPTAFKIGNEWRIEEQDLWEVEIERLKQHNGMVKTAR